MEQALRRQKFESAEGGRAPGGPDRVVIAPAERPRWIEQAARAAGWEAPAGQQPPEALLESQEEFLVQSLAAGPEQLRELGAERVEAIMRALLADPAVAQERLFARQADAKDQEKATQQKCGVRIGLE